MPPTQGAFVLAWPCIDNWTRLDYLLYWIANGWSDTIIDGILCELAILSSEVRSTGDVFSQSIQTLVQTTTEQASSSMRRYSSPGGNSHDLLSGGYS